MCSITDSENYFGVLTMQKIDFIVNELKTIMQNNDISQNAVINLLNGKCAKNTIISFFKGDADCKLSTLLMILDACGVDLRLETERSRQAIMSGDIAEYRAETEKLRSELSKVTDENEHYKGRNEELISKNTSLTNTIEKQQTTIETYMRRMERAEEALYSSNADARRKDEKIVELLKAAGKW